MLAFLGSNKEKTNQHKWHKEIKAWADDDQCIEVCKAGIWYSTDYPNWNFEDEQFRIKPQPKQPKYLYAIQTENKGVLGGEIRLIPAGQMFSGTLIGKIEVQDD